MATVTVTSRSRSIGFAWTNQPVRTPSGGLMIDDPATYRPEVVGTPRQVLTEIEHIRRNNSGNDWRWTLFVGDRRMTEFDGYGPDRRSQMMYLLEYLCERNATCTVEVE